MARVVKIDSVLIIVINIYGYNNDKNQISTVVIKLNANFPTDPVVAGSDFT